MEEYKRYTQPFPGQSWRLAGGLTSDGQQRGRGFGTSEALCNGEGRDRHRCRGAIC
jgi:hypothetical protein